MSNTFRTTLSDRTGSNRGSIKTRLKYVFVGERGIRAGWSALFFAAIFWILQSVVLAFLGRFVSLDDTVPIPLSLGFLQEFCLLLAVAAATLVMARIENRRFLSYGFTGNHRLSRLLTGMLFGFLFLSLLVGVLWKAGLLVFDGVTLHGVAAWKNALGWAVLFLVVGLFEESLFRGYLQCTLARGIGFWWAAVVLSGAFALGHVSNKGEIHPWGRRSLRRRSRFLPQPLVYKIVVVGGRVPRGMGLGPILFLRNPG